MSCRCLYAYSIATLCVGAAGATAERSGRGVAGGGGGTVVFLPVVRELDELELDELELDELGALAVLSSMITTSGADFEVRSSGFFRLVGGWVLRVSWLSVSVGLEVFRCQAGFGVHNSEWWARWRV